MDPDWRCISYAKMAIFHCYVSLPEGNFWGPNFNTYQYWMWNDVNFIALNGAGYIYKTGKTSRWIYPYFVAKELELQVAKYPTRIHPHGKSMYLVKKKVVDHLTINLKPPQNTIALQKKMVHSTSNSIWVLNPKNSGFFPPNHPF